MNWFVIVKGLVAFTASAGAGTVVTNIVSATAPVNANSMNKVMTTIGGFILSSMVGASASAYVSKEFDTMFPPQENAKAA